MDPERWEQVARIYEGAADRPPDERGAYLAQACGEDEPLRREVESLLDQEGTPVLIDRPALESARELLQPDAAAAPAGTQLGPYQLGELIGSGGMGHVYRATDTRLNRTVAIKVLADAVALDPQSRERFQREARAIAALTHPHICTVHDVGQQPGDSGSVIDFLVMEYVEGEPLSARLARGPLALDESLRYAVQIASALDKAHREGIVHRDLKPGNVMLTTGGIKLLDFGLAKIAGPAALGASAAGSRPAPAHLTSPGTVLGTFQYMAPEQLEGDDADARTDIFAFGTVVYEMLTGVKAFQGKSQASLIGAIMYAEPPPVSARQPLSPPALDRVITTCLAKDPDARWQSAADLTRQLRWIAESSPRDPVPVGPMPVSRRRPLSRAALAWGGASVLLLATGYVARRGVNPTPQDLPVTRFSFSLPDGWTLTTLRTDAEGSGVNTMPLAVSHDGRRIAYAAVDQAGQQRIWIRSLDNLDPQPVNGTERGADPFWSPDDQHLAFFADDKLKKVPSAGGTAVVLSDAPDAQGGSWGADDTIVFSSASVIQRMPAAGGVAAAVTQRDPADLSHARPALLPGRHFLYSAIRRGQPHGLFAASLDSGVRKLLMTSDTMNVWYSRGHLLFVLGSSLMAVRFDAHRLEMSGQPFPVVAPVHTQRAAPTVGVFAASENGVLAYQSGTGAAVSQLMLVDRTGRATQTIGQPAAFTGLSLSPDSRRLAVGVIDGPGVEGDVWLYDLGTGGRRRLTFGEPIDGTVVWSPDGRRIVFKSQRPNGSVLIIRPIDGTPDQVLPLDAMIQAAWQPMDWSPDGRLILGSGGGQLWTVPVDGTQKPARWGTDAEGMRSHAQFDPTGRWIAYQAARRGATEIYVSSFPAGGPTWQVSTHGGVSPRWSSTGREIYFFGADGGLVAAPVNLNAQYFQVGDARPLFRISRKLLPSRFGSPYEVYHDGTFFIMNTVSQADTPASITVVLNWIANP